MSTIGRIVRAAAVPAAVVAPLARFRLFYTADDWLKRTTLAAEGGIWEGTRTWADNQAIWNFTTGNRDAAIDPVPP